MKLENFARTTGRSWEKWLEFLNEIGAGELTHTEIAQRIHDTGDATGWWSQSIALAYEQHIGRRVPGQVREGEYVVSAESASTLIDVTEKPSTVATPQPAGADAPMCMTCGVQMMRAGSCHACPSCGSTSGCS